MNKTILIVEDDENIREMVRMALTSFAYQVITCDNAEDALSLISQSKPDMIIFDIMLPGMSGLEATKTLRSDPLTQSIPILMLTAKDSELDKVTGLDYGADDYISKPFGVMELAARIRSIFRRVEKGYEPVSDVVNVADLTINNNTREVMQDNSQIDLTFKEYELLFLLIRERDRIVSREELLQTVWGFDFLGESRTLDIHVSTLRQKLGDDADNPRYIKTVRNVGYRFVGDQQ